ncbi:hypothetical protein MPEAHAMD_6593 [Methylobacterium frigidaeris]|uniref:NAD(P)-binding domain-containing protein n=1 Tax=Methylobacterium frigidaeris TaxID=2038277 RepID=A0AA37HIY2_9HYPH|nr:hypothetical protein MPEAHAMD_6593 [Methylobacterium frigidaeris]
MKIVVIGGCGLIGRQVTADLLREGHEAVTASPSTGVNALTGEGIAEMLADAAVVVDVANAPSLEPAAALEFFERSGRNLLAAERQSGIRHHVALSIVGTDRLQENAYFRAKEAQERLIAAASLPYMIVRATQFFEFVATSPRPRWRATGSTCPMPISSRSPRSTSRRPSPRWPSGCPPTGRSRSPGRTGSRSTTSSPGASPPPATAGRCRPTGRRATSAPGWSGDPSFPRTRLRRASDPDPCPARKLPILRRGAEGPPCPAGGWRRRLLHRLPEPGPGRAMRSSTIRHPVRRRPAVSPGNPASQRSCAASS